MPHKLIDPCIFTILYSIGPVKIGHTLCDLGKNLNLMSLSMMGRLNCGEPKPTQMDLTLAYQSITYTYGVLEDVIMMVYDLLFPIDFVNLNMVENFETPLLIGRTFLETGRVLINVKMGEIIFRFNKEHIVFNIFEAMKHQKENPQCYGVYVVEEINQKVVTSESPSSLMG